MKISILAKPESDDCNHAQPVSWVTVPVQTTCFLQHASINHGQKQSKHGADVGDGCASKRWPCIKLAVPTFVNILTGGTSWYIKR